MIKLVTDSTSYMTEEYAKQHDIKIIPLSLILGSKEITEGMPGSFDEAYDLLLADNDTSKSSQPAPDKFKQAFDSIISEGNEVFAITISSSLSGTYNSARLASTMSDESRITVYDSKGCAQLMLLFIEEAVKMIKEGKSRAEIKERLDSMQSASSEIFVPVTLRHLIRGGRIGGVAAAIGTILNVKPLLAFSNGILSCKKKVIGMQRALRELIAEIPKTAKKIYVMRIYKSEFFKQLYDKVSELFPFAQINQGEVGPVVGIHVGPGTIGIAYC